MYIDFPALPGSQSGLGGQALKPEATGSTSLNSNLSLLSQDSQLLHNSSTHTFSGVAAVGGASGNSSGTAISRTVGTSASASASLNFTSVGANASGSAQATASTQSLQPVMQNLYQGQHIMGGGLGDLSSSSAASGSTAAPISAVLSKEGRFGLAGLLDIIRVTDKDSTALALGSDLTTYGLNLTSTDCLYASFTSPFNEQPSTVEPHFQTPQCYMLQPTSLKAEHLTKFQIETLFYMFYNMPKDLMQAFSAQELYRREWRFHAELKLWLKVRPPELMQSHPNVQFVFFDTSTWEVRPMTTVYRGNIGAGLVSEEEVRVKILPQGLAGHPGPPSAAGGSGQPSFLGNT